LAELLSLEDVVDQLGTHHDYKDTLEYLQKLFDGTLADGNLEAKNVEIIDTHGGFEDSNAGILKIWRTDGNPEWFSTSSEHTVYLWREFFGLND